MLGDDIYFTKDVTHSNCTLCTLNSILKNEYKKKLVESWLNSGIPTDNTRLTNSGKCRKELIWMSIEYSKFGGNVIIQWSNLLKYYFGEEHTKKLTISELKLMAEANNPPPDFRYAILNIPIINGIPHVCHIHKQENRLMLLDSELDGPILFKDVAKSRFEYIADARVWGLGVYSKYIL